MMNKPHLSRAHACYRTHGGEVWWSHENCPKAPDGDLNEAWNILTLDCYRKTESLMCLECQARFGRKATEWVVKSHRSIPIELCGLEEMQLHAKEIGETVFRAHVGFKVKV